MPEPLSNTNTAGRKRSVHRRVFAAGVVALALLLLTGSGHASRASVIGDVFLRATFGVLAPSPRPAQTSATNAVVSTQQASVFSSTRVRVTQASPRTESIPEPTWFGSPSPRTSPAAAAVAVPAIPEPTWFGAPVLRTAVPTVQTRSEFGQRVSALRFPDDGREGQILMIENGKAVWKDFPGVYSPGLGRRPFPVGGSSGGESGPVQRSYGGGGGGGDSGNSGGTGGTGGLSQSDADGRYVNVPGDTMTGLLNILVDGLGLNVTGTISGSVLHAEQLLTSSGDLIVAGDAVVHGNLSGATLTISGLKNCNTIDTDADGNFVCGTDEGGAGSSYRAGQGLTLNTITNTFTLNSTITGSLLEFTTVSGSVVHAQTVLRSSGVLLVEGATSLSGSLAVEGNSFLGGTLAVTGNTTLAAGLKLLHSDFFGCTALETDADGDLVCGSDSDTTYSVGRGLTLNGTVITLNTTLTGSSLTFQTISGSTITANSRLTSSGVLAVEGNSFLQGTVRITSLTNCNTLDTNSSGDLVCGTDEGTTYTAAQGLVLTSNSFRLASSISGSLVNFQTVSGTTLFANNTLRSSGSLIVQTTGLFKGNLTTRGNLSGATLTVSTLKNCNTLDTDANGNLSCGTDEGSTYVAGQGIGLTGNVFRLNGTLTGSLVSFQTVSGSTISAANRLTSSGVLAVEGTSYLQGTVRLAALTNCNSLDTDPSGNLVCGTDEGTTYSAAQGLTLNGTAFRLNGAITGSLVNFTTVSGSSVFARTNLLSSGSLTVEGAFNVGGAASQVYNIISDSGAASHAGGGGLDSDDDLFIAGTIEVDGISYYDNSVNFASGIAVVGTYNVGGVGARAYNIISDSGSASHTDVIDSDDDLFIEGSLEVDGSVQLDGGLNVLGTASGRVLHAQDSLRSSGSLLVDGVVYLNNYQNCTALETSNGQIVCGTDDTGAGGASFGTGSLTTYFDNRFVNVSGDTMTGALAIRSGNGTVTVDAGVLLEVLGTASGRIVHVQDQLRSSGSLLVDGAVYFNNYANCTALETSNGQIVCGTDDGGTSYFAGRGLTLTAGVFTLNTTITGSLLEFTTVSGSLVSATDRLTSSGVLAVEGNSFFGGTINAGSSAPIKLLNASFFGCTALETDADGDLVCGTDDNTTYTAAQGLTLNGTSFRLNATITGSSLTFQTISGSTVTANNRLASSGVLAVEGNSFLQGTVRLTALTNCNTLDTNSNGDLVCGTDSNSQYGAGQGLTLTGTGFRLNTTITGSLVNFQTLSGMTVYARSQLRSSGSLVVDTTGLIKGNLTTRGTLSGAALTVMAGNSYLLGNLNLGSSTVDSNLKLEIIGTASGRVLHAQDQLRASGSLLVDGAVYFNNYANCTSLETSNGQIVCGTDDGGTSYVAGRGLTLTSNVFTLNTTITGSLLEFTTVSGSTLFANNRLASSGVLAVDGNAYLNSGAYIYNLAIENGFRLLDSVFVSCPLLITDDAGSVECGDVSSLEDYGVLFTSTGSLRASFDSRYVNVSGDTMTGALAIKKRSGTNTGNTLVVDTNGLVYDATNKRVGIGTAMPDDGLLYVSTQNQLPGTYDSGLTGVYIDADMPEEVTTTNFGPTDYGLYVNSDSQRTLSVDEGSLHTMVQAGISVSASHVGDATTSGVGSAVNRKVYGIDATAVMTMAGRTGNGIDLVYGGYFGAAMAEDLNSPGSAAYGIYATATGAVAWSGYFDDADVFIQEGLEVIGTASGRTIHAQNQLRSSGSLLVDGVVYLNNYANCTALETVNGLVTCGTDNGSSYSAGQGLTLTGTGFRLNTTITGSLVNFQTLSGMTVYARSQLRSSGSLVVDTTGLIKGNLTTRGTLSGAALTVMAGNSYLLGNLNLGSSTVDSNLKLEIIGTASGRILHAQDRLEASGALVVRSTTTNPVLYTDVTNGRVGIGTAAPTSDLTIASTGIPKLTLHGTNGHTSYIDFNRNNGNNSWRIEASGTFVLYNSTNAYSTTVNLMDLGTSEIVFNNDAGNTDFRIEGDTKSNLFFLDASTDNIGINTNAPGSKLALSGAMIINSTGTTGMTADTGLALEIIGTASGRVLHAQDVLRASGSLLVDGAVYFNNYANCTSLETVNGLVTCGTDDGTTYLAGRGLTVSSNVFTLNTTITGSLLEFTTVSGATVHAQDLLRSSGALAVEGNSFLQGNISLGDSTSDNIAANGLFNTSLLPAANVTYDLGNTSNRWNGLYANTGNFSGNVNMNGNVGLGDGAADNVSFNGLANTSILLAANNSYDLGNSSNRWATLYAVNGNFATNVTATNISARNTLSGSALTIMAGNSSFLGPLNLGSTNYDSNIKLEIIGMASGRVLHAQDRLASSGTLVVQSGVTFKSLTNCSALQTDSAGALSCGSAGGLSQTTADSRYVNVSGDTMTGGLIIRSGNGTAFLDSGILFEVLGVASGRILHAQDILRSSGSLIVDGSAYFNGNVSTNFIPASNATYDLGNTSLRWNNLYANTGNFSGNVNMNGNVGLGDATSDNIAANGLFNTSLLPAANVTYDLGNTSNRWNGLYAGTGNFSGNLFANGNVSLGDAAGDNISFNGSANTSILAAANNSYALGNSTNRWSNIFSVDGNFSNNISVNNLYANTNVSARNTLSGGALTIMSGNSSFLGPLNLGSTAIDTNVKLEIIGMASGRVLHAQDRLASSGTLVVQSTGLVKGNLTTRGTLSGAALTVMAGNSYLLGSVNIGSSTVDTNLKLEVIGTASGRVIHAQDKLESSGALVIRTTRPYPLLYTDTTNYRLGLGTASPGSRLALSGAMIINANGNLGSSAADTGVSLEIIGMASGRVLHAQDRLASSGTLVVQSTGLVKGNLTTRGTLSGAALTVMAGNSYLLGSVNIGSSTVDTNLKLEIIGTASGRVIHAQDQLRASGSLLVDGAVYFNNYANCTALETVNGLITCGTDDGSSYFAGRGLTLTSNVFTLNTTITGSLLEFTTVSGAIVHAQDQLRSSGTLIVRSTTRLQSGAYITGHVVPTADATYDLGSNTNRWRDLYISGTSVHMGTSVSEGVMGYNSSDGFHFTGAGGAEVRGTASGRTVHAQDSLRSSGSLIVDGLAYLNNYANCTALETANGVLTCGTDGGGAASIGDAVGSGTQGSVLFLGPSGVLAQDNTNFFYNDSLNLLKLGGTFVVGGSTTSNAGYNLISNNDSSVASHTASDQINTSDDLYIGGALEVDGYAFFDTGVRLGHTFIVGGATTSASYNKITTNDSSVATNLDSTDDLYISGSLEVDSAAFFDNSLTFSAITSCSFLATDVSGNVYCNTSSAGGDFWALTGNSGINASAQFVGTTDGTHLAFRTNNTERMRILDMGMVGINTSAPNATLDVNGNLHVGGVSNLVPYSFFATNGSSMAGHGLDGYSDVFIEQSLEVDGIAFFDSTVQISGLTNCSVLATDSSGNIFCNTSSLGGGGITEGSLAYSGGDAGSGDSSAGSSASTLALSYPSDVYVQGNYAYVTDLYAHTLNAFDVSDPADPVQIFSISTGLFTPEAVYVQGRYAYVTNQDTSILTIMDVSNPARITSVGSVTLAGLLRDVYVQGRYAYVVSNNDTLNVIDVSNPKNPIRVGVVSTNLADPYAIYVQGRYAYVADVEANAMYVFDVSDPAAPTYVSSGTNFTSLPTGIYVQGRYAYIAAQGNDGVSIYDISNPAYPVHISTTTSNMSDPESVYVQGEYMYVTNLGGTLGVYDVSNPASVSFVDSESTSLSVPRALFVLGQHAYLTDTSNSKLHVLNAFGTYIHQLGVGGFEAGTGLFRENLQVFNDTDIRGALTVGQGMNVVGGASITASGSLSYALRVNANSGALLLTTGTTDSAVNAFRIMSNVTSANNPVFSIRADGTVYSDGSYNGTGADYAEWFRTADTDLVPGDAVCIDVTRENSVRKCRGDGDPDVIGIVSTNPSFVGNVMSGADGVPVPGTVLVGLIGQVPAKAVIASGSVIRPGDSLTAAALSGYVRKAMAGESTVGVALTGLTGNTGTTGTIQVLISRRNQSLTTEAVSERVLQTVQDLKIQDELELSLQQAVAQFSASGTLMQPISEEVSRQVSALNVQSIEERLAALNARIDSLSGGTVTVAGDSALNALAARISQLETSLGGSSAGTGTTSADLVASTLNVEDTLIVGSNARIAGDLELDGTLRVSSLFIPGIVTIDGALTASSLDADTLTVSSGATIGGVLTIQGSLELASGATLGFASGSTVDFSTLVVRNALHVLGPVTIEGLAQFLGDVQVHGELQVSDRQAGMAKIPMSGTSVTITFDPPTTVQPIVTASPDVPVLYAVSNATMTGFTIRLAAPATEDITFSWHALGAFTFDPSALTSSSSSSSSVGIAFPVDASGVPLSSNAVWNACIRNQVTLDADGNPLSCSRYHEDYVWTHPDLSIEFTWNTQTTPPLLVLPDGYSRVEETMSEEITEPAPEETPLEEPVTEPPSETPSDTPPPEETPSDVPADLPPAEEPVLEPEASPSVEPSGDEPVEEPALPEETPSATDEPVEAAPPAPQESVPVTP